MIVSEIATARDGWRGVRLVSEPGDIPLEPHQMWPQNTQHRAADSLDLGVRCVLVH
jgi:hypothetical protein